MEWQCAIFILFQTLLNTKVGITRETGMKGGLQILSNLGFLNQKRQLKGNTLWRETPKPKIMRHYFRDSIRRGDC